MDEGDQHPDARLEALCANLSAGLHAAAQPLTILRASMGLDQATQMSCEELRKLVANSAREVERVCALFSVLQQFVQTENTQPSLTESPIKPLIVHVVEGVNLLFERDGMSLVVVGPESCGAVLVDRARVLQAFSTILLRAHALSSPSDTVEFTWSDSASSVHLAIQNARLHVEGMSAETRLGFALAEAAVRSMQGKLSWSLQPFNVQIELQKVSASN
jgi:hypothetical protein